MRTRAAMAEQTAYIQALERKGVDRPVIAERLGVRLSCVQRACAAPPMATLRSKKPVALDDIGRQLGLDAETVERIVRVHQARRAVSVTIDLPAELYDMLRAAAEVRDCSTDSLVASILDVVIRADLISIIRGEIPADGIVSRDFLLQAVTLGIVAGRGKG